MSNSWQCMLLSATLLTSNTNSIQQSRHSLRKISTNIWLHQTVLLVLQYLHLQKMSNVECKLCLCCAMVLIKYFCEMWNLQLAKSVKLLYRSFLSVVNGSKISHTVNRNTYLYITWFLSLNHCLIIIKNKLNIQGFFRSVTCAQDKTRNPGELDGNVTRCATVVSAIE